MDSGRRKLRKASQEQEADVARRVGGRVQPASGAGWMHKGDVSETDFLIECKMTGARSYRLTLDTLLKIEREAILENKEFALFLRIAGRDYAVIDADVFSEAFDMEP